MQLLAKVMVDLLERFVTLEVIVDNEFLLLHDIDEREKITLYMTGHFHTCQNEIIMDVINPPFSISEDGKLTFVFMVILLPDFLTYSKLSIVKTACGVCSNAQDLWARMNTLDTFEDEATVCIGVYSFSTDMETKFQTLVD